MFQAIILSKKGKWQNLILDSILTKKFFQRFYLYFMVHIVASYHCMKFQGKLMKQTWENSKKPNFGTDFGPLRPT